MGTDDLEKPKPPRPHCSWCGLPIMVRLDEATGYWFMPNGVLGDHGSTAWHQNCHNEYVKEEKAAREQAKKRDKEE